MAPNVVVKARNALMLRPGQDQPEGLNNNKWSAATGYALLRWIPKWSNNVATIIGAFCKWGFQPRPKGNGAIAFTDCILQLSDAAVVQVLRRDAVDVYCKIPVSLVIKPPDHFQAWFRQIFVTCVAGHEDALNLELAIESLCDPRPAYSPPHRLLRRGRWLVPSTIPTYNSK